MKSKRKWTPAEDQALLAGLEVELARKWNRIEPDVSRITCFLSCLDSPGMPPAHQHAHAPTCQSHF